MYFTREPILESVITPREGCKLVVRSSKVVGQEEFFVDAIEVVTFGSSLFYRSLEKPKPFLLPVTDYEVLEVRETKMVLRHTVTETKAKSRSKAKEDEAKGDGERKKERRRKRRRKEEEPAAEEVKETDESADFPLDEPAPEPKEKPKVEEPAGPPPDLSAMIPPPETLISESIDQYKAMLPPEPEVEPEGEKEEEPQGSLFSPSDLLSRLRGREEEEVEHQD